MAAAKEQPLNSTRMIIIGQWGNVWKWKKSSRNIAPSWTNMTRIKRSLFYSTNGEPWWDEEPGTIKGHLYQQNTLRDAFVASLSLDVFHKYTDRLKMANIAQIVNVLQSMILTKDKEMVLTPTYYVFKMYKVHQDATYLPIELTCEKMSVRDNRTVPMVSATASKNKDGVIHLSLSNVDADEAQEITINLGDTKAKKQLERF